MEVTKKYSKEFKKDRDNKLNKYKKAEEAYNSIIDRLINNQELATSQLSEPEEIRGDSPEVKIARFLYRCIIDEYAHWIGLGLSSYESKELIKESLEVLITALSKGLFKDSETQN